MLELAPFPNILLAKLMIYPALCKNFNLKLGKTFKTSGERESYH
jgi:hypothetical protein